MGSIFLLPGDVRLDDACGETAGRFVASDIALGFISAVFDNIPLTKLLLKQGTTIGVSSPICRFRRFDALVRLLRRCCRGEPVPEAKSVGQWLRHGWMVLVGYVVGFFVMLAVLGWHPHEKHKDDLPAPPAATLAAPTSPSPV